MYDPDIFEKYNPFADRHHIQFHLVFTLDEPLSQKGESTGNQSNLKTTIVSTLDGFPAPVFEYSANSIRNGWTGRRSVMRSFLERVGLLVDESHHRSFYAGGTIDGGTGNDMDREERIRRFIPPASVWGWAMQRGSFGGTDAGMMPGRLSVGAGHLLCYENAEYFYKECPGLLSNDVREAIAAILDVKLSLQKEGILRHLRQQPLQSQNEADQLQQMRRQWVPFLQNQMKSYIDLIVLDQKVRFDSIYDPELTPTLIPSDRVLTDTQKRGRPVKKGEKSTIMMPSTSWLIQPGAQLYSQVRSRHGITEIEEGAIVDAWVEWSRSPFLGGMGNTACGRASLQVFYRTEAGEADLYLEISGNTQQLSARAERVHNLYLQFLQGARDNFAQYQGFMPSAKPVLLQIGGTDE